MSSVMPVAFRMVAATAAVACTLLMLPFILLVVLPLLILSRLVLLLTGASEEARKRSKPPRAPSTRSTRQSARQSARQAARQAIAKPAPKPAPVLPPPVPRISIRWECAGCGRWMDGPSIDQDEVAQCDGCDRPSHAQLCLRDDLLRSMAGSQDFGCLSPKIGPVAARGAQATYSTRLAAFRPSANETRERVEAFLFWRRWDLGEDVDDGLEDDLLDLDG